MELTTTRCGRQLTCQFSPELIGSNQWRPFSGCRYANREPESEHSGTSVPHYYVSFLYANPSISRSRRQLEPAECCRPRPSTCFGLPLPKRLLAPLILVSTLYFLIATNQQPQTDNQAQMGPRAARRPTTLAVVNLVALKRFDMSALV